MPTAWSTSNCLLELNIGAPQIYYAAVPRERELGPKTSRPLTNATWNGSTIIHDVTGGHRNRPPMLPDLSAFEEPCVEANPRLCAATPAVKKSGIPRRRWT